MEKERSELGVESSITAVLLGTLLAATFADGGAPDTRVAVDG